MYRERYRESVLFNCRFEFNSEADIKLSIKITIRTYRIGDVFCNVICEVTSFARPDQTFSSTFYTQKTTSDPKSEKITQKDNSLNFNILYQDFAWVSILTFKIASKAQILRKFQQKNK